MDLILLLMALGAGIGAATGVGGSAPDAEEPAAEIGQLPEGTPDIVEPEPEGEPAPDGAPGSPSGDRADGGAPPAPGWGAPASNDAGSLTPETPAAPPDGPQTVQEPPDSSSDMADEAQDAGGFVAEDQSPTGKFTTATEVRPILTATRDNWIAVRDYGGQDLLYFTQLLAWRCGLHRIDYSINGAPSQTFEAEPCHDDTATPNAIRADAVQPYLSFPPGSLERVGIELLYDDLSRDSATFERAQILMP